MPRSVGMSSRIPRVTMPSNAASMEWVWAPSREVIRLGGLAVVQLALPGVVGRGVDVGDGLPVKDHADVFSGAPAGKTAFRRIGVPALAAVHHVPLHLVSNIGGRFGDDWAGAAYGNAVLNQSCGLLSLGRRDQVQAALLVVVSPAAPVAEAVEPLQDLGFRRYFRCHEGLLVFLTNVGILGLTGLIVQCPLTAPGLFKPVEKRR